MSEIANRYVTVAAGFTARLDNLSTEQWSAPTPCPDWTVRDLVAHVIGTQRAVMSRVTDASPVEVEAEGDLRAQWAEANRAIVGALGDEASASKVVGGMFGEQSFESLVGRLVCTDLLVHTWDLARATGQDENLDPTAVARAHEFLASIDEAIRAPGGFAEKIAPPAEADEQVRFLNFCGRAV